MDRALSEEEANVVRPKGYETYATGCTTRIFVPVPKHKKIYGITADKYKIAWLRANAREFKFKLLKTDSVTLSKPIYHYKMLHLDMLDSAQEKLLKTQLLNKLDGAYYTNGSLHPRVLGKLLPFVRDKLFRDLIDKLMEVYGDETDVAIDLHMGQFMSLNGKIVCIDPVFKP